MKRRIIPVMLVCLIGIVSLSFWPQKNRLTVYTHEPGPWIENEWQGNLYHSLLQDLNELGIPGLQVSVIRRGEAWDLALGTVDYDRTTNITPGHLLRVGSVTKIYTATIIMKLCEEGLLSLDTTIDAWFPDLHHGQDITVKQLLNHTSGIYNYTENWPLLLTTTFLPRKHWEPDAIYQYIIKGNPYFAPGEKHYYSNSNYFLLGLLAEQVTGKKYGELLQDFILTPLQLQNTYILPEARPPELLITGYDRDLFPLGINKIKPDNRGWASTAYAAGGIAANAADVSRFLQGLFTGRIISPAALEQMMEFEPFTDEDIPAQSGYGLGLRRLVVEGDVLIGHTGTIPGFGAAAFYCPDKDYYIAFLGNVSLLDQARLLRTIVKTMQAPL